MKTAHPGITDALFFSQRRFIEPFALLREILLRGFPGLELRVREQATRPIPANAAYKTNSLVCARRPKSSEAVPGQRPCYTILSITFVSSAPKSPRTRRPISITS